MNDDDRAEETYRIARSIDPGASARWIAVIAKAIRDAKGAAMSDYFDGKDAAYKECEAKIAARDSEIARLKAALRPFAKAADAVYDDDPDDEMAAVLKGHRLPDRVITVGALRAARNALAPKEPAK